MLRSICPHEHWRGYLSCFSKKFTHSRGWLKSDNAINLDSYVKLRDYIAQQLGEAGADMPNLADLVSTSGSSPKPSSPDFGLLTPMSPDFSNPNSLLPLAFPPDFLSSPAALSNQELPLGYVDAPPSQSTDCVLWLACFR